MIRQTFENSLHSIEAKNQLTLATRWFCKFTYMVIGAVVSNCTQATALCGVCPADDVSLPQEVF